MTRTLRIGTRGSALALVQANWVAARLADAGVRTEIADHPDRGRRPAGRHGLGRGRLRRAGSWRRCSTAAWTWRSTPPRTCPPTSTRVSSIAAYPPREDPRDALVCRARGTTLATLPEGARVGTDSPRRTAFLRADAPRSQDPPAARQRGHAPGQARSRRQRRPGARGRRADPAGPRRPDRRDPAPSSVALRPGAGGARAAGPGRRCGGDRGGGAAGRSRDTGRRRGGAGAAAARPAAAAGRRSAHSDGCARDGSP